MLGAGLEAVFMKLYWFEVNYQKKVMPVVLIGHKVDYSWERVVFP